MAQFVSPRDYSHFVQAIMNRSRFVHSAEVRSFLETAVETGDKRAVTLKRATIYWRAQRGHCWRTENNGEENQFEVPDAYPPERMTPKAEFAKDGRANPHGIPCLYLATADETAIGEVRPWVGSYVSLAQFKIMRDLKVVDCSKDRQLLDWVLRGDKYQITPEHLERIVWGDINYAFSKPVTSDESPTAYVPTQTLAEAFRLNGYDGIVYRSLLGGGFNVALFDCHSAELINCGLYEVRKVSFNFDLSDNPYFITKHYPELQKTSDATESLPPEENDR